MLLLRSSFWACLVYNRLKPDLSYGLSCFGAYLPQSRRLLVIVVRFHTGLGLFFCIPGLLSKWVLRTLCKYARRIHPCISRRIGELFRDYEVVQSNTDQSYGLCCFEAYLPQSRGLLVIVVRFHTGLGLFCLSCVRLDYAPFSVKLAISLV